MKVSSTVLAKFSKNNQCWHLKTCILSLSWKGSYCHNVFNIVSDILKVRVFDRYDMKFILLLSSPDNLSIPETLPFFDYTKL